MSKIWAWAFGLPFVAFGGSALAQVTAPASQAIVAGLGVSTSGAETGIFEVQAAIVAGLAIVFAIVLVRVGYMVVVRMLRRVAHA